MKTNRAALTDEDLAALKTVARTEGRYWKHQLWAMWERASYPGYDAATAGRLQYLRNAAYFGPAGLDRFKLRKETTMRPPAEAEGLSA